MYLLYVQDYVHVGLIQLLAAKLQHCLNTLLPSIKDIKYSLKSTGTTNYILPQCKYNLFKGSFINWDLIHKSCLNRYTSCF